MRDAIFYMLQRCTHDTHTNMSARETISGQAGFERKLLIRYHFSLGSDSYRNDSCSHLFNGVPQASTATCCKGAKNKRIKSIYRHCREKKNTNEEKEDSMKPRPRIKKRHEMSTTSIPFSVSTQYTLSQRMRPMHCSTSYVFCTFSNEKCMHAAMQPTLQHTFCLQNMHGCACVGESMLLQSECTVRRHLIAC